MSSLAFLPSRASFFHQKEQRDDDARASLLGDALSTLIPLRDGNARHVGALWAGTLFNFGPDAARFRAYAESAAKFREIATTAGADVLLSNHTDYDGMKQKLPALASGRAGVPHP